MGAAVKPKRYAAKHRLDFADGASVPRNTILTTPRIPAWVRILLHGCVPLHVQGKVRIVADHEVKEIK